MHTIVELVDVEVGVKNNAPHLADRRSTPWRNRISVTVATHDCTRDTVRDLTQAGSKFGKYLQENTPGTLDPKAESL